ncbi:MAG: YicC/YloC family endoribonuclease [Hyphomicrobiales bacterium]
MTGFARSEGELNGTRWHWEARSVNGKSLDVRLRMPPGFEQLEPEVRAAVSKHLRRGNCQLSLQVTRDFAAGELRINQAALDSVLAAIESMAGRIEAQAPSLDGLLAIKGVVELSDTDEDEETVSARNAAILRDLNTALAALAEARREEGQRLESVVGQHVDAIALLSEQARDCPARKPDAIRARLKDQIERILEQSSAFDEERLHQEAVLLAAKVDVQEELDRLFAHVSAARDLLEKDEAVGRRLDFLTQEFNREANTLCSKANDPALTGIGLEMKSVIDQMREQVQNVE